MIPTIRDVARESQVSIATVSRILNGLTGYSDTTKQKVLLTIKRMGYQPNAIARSLTNKRTRTIGVLFPDVSNEFSTVILQGIEEVANDYHYSVFVCNTAVDGNRTLNYLQVLREKQVDGIIFSSEVLKEEYIQALDKMQIPLVLVASETERSDIPFVKVDDRKASYDATSYLIRMGHREIAMISGTKGDPIAGTPRVEGYKQALEEHGIPFIGDRVVYGNFRFDSGFHKMEQLLQAAWPITAVFAASDEMAVGALNCAIRHGIRVPDEMSIIGYDNLKLSEMVIPSLTTVQQPLVELGKQAFEKLLTMMETGKQVDSTILPHEIIERHTVKPIT